MLAFDVIHDRAAARAGGPRQLAKRMPPVSSREELVALSDSFYLSAMTRRIFQAGMKHSLINERWPVFDEWFWAFDPEKLMLLSEEQLESAMQNPKLIRHWGKLRTIPVNAGEVQRVSGIEGGFGRFLADWPDDDLFGLWAWLAKHFQRMGGQSGARFLRLVGRDTFLLTEDVIAALMACDVIDAKPTRKADKEKVSQAFVAWQVQSGLPLSHISRMLSMTVD